MQHIFPLPIARIWPNLRLHHPRPQRRIHRCITPRVPRVGVQEAVPVLVRAVSRGRAGAGTGPDAFELALGGSAVVGGVENVVVGVATVVREVDGHDGGGGFLNRGR